MTKLKTQTVSGVGLNRVEKVIIKQSGYGYGGFP